MWNRTLVLWSLAVLTLAGCENNREFGRVVGGIAGAKIGSQVGRGNDRVFTTVVGAIVGSAIGDRIGRDMDAHSREKMANALETSRSGVVTSWQNPDHANQRYSMVPGPAFHRGVRVCRPFTITVKIDGQTMIREGIACRDKYGRWIVQN